MTEKKLTIDDWLQIGEEAGFCSPAVCQTHDMIEMTPEEEADFEDGGDPCIPVTRLWAQE